MRSLPERPAGFTLVEMLAVITVILIIVGLLVPAMKGIKGNGDVTSASYDISGVIENARSYAMANNTYTWVGFYEESAGTQIATGATPPYPGKGRVLVAVVYAKDGTTSCQNPAATAANPITMTTTLFAQLGKLVKVENLHVTDIGAPNGATDINTLDGRPGVAYTYAAPNDHYNRVSSDSSDVTAFPFAAQGYTFYKTLQFSPRGEVNVNGAAGLKPLVEIGLQPSNGTVPATNSKNVVAIQVTGISGNVKIYRR